MRFVRTGMLISVVSLMGAVSVAAPQNTTKIVYATNTIALDRDITVKVRHADLAHFDIADAEPSLPTLTVSVTTHGKTSPEATITGDKDFPPWGYATAFARDLDSDGHKEAFICSFCNFGGSGEARYLTLVHPRPGLVPLLLTLPRGEQENIQTSTFFLAQDAQRHPAIVITHPLMDGETRVDPTHWKISAYRIDIPGVRGAEAFRAIPAGEKRTAKRYSERVPESVVAQSIPKGWNLSTPLY